MLLLASLAFALDSGAVPDPAVLYPYAVTIHGEGDRAWLADPRRDEIPTAGALQLVGLPEVAERYRIASRRRTVLGVVGWSAGGALLYVAAVGGVALNLTEGTQVALGATGVALVGGGFAAKFAGRKRHIGGWATPDSLLAGVEAHNAEVALRYGLVVVPAQGAVDGPTGPIAASVGAGASFRLTLHEDGRVTDARGRELSVAALAKTLGDDDIAADHRAARRLDRAIWLPTTIVGGGLTGGGLMLLAVGGLQNWVQGPGSGADVTLAGVACTGLGGAGLATGITGMVVSKKRHEDPLYWYDLGTLGGEVRDWNRRVDPGGTAWLQVTPVVGPGTVGLVGQF